MRLAKPILLVMLAAVTLVGVNQLHAAPIDYDESSDGDLDQGNPPSFNLDVGDNSWRGTIGPTPTPNTADNFDAVLPAGLRIAHIRWEYSANGGDQGSMNITAPGNTFVVGHTHTSSGDNILDSGFSNANPTLPLVAAGAHKVEIITDFAIQTSSWRLILTVEAIPVQVETSTWGSIKSLYH